MPSMNFGQYTLQGMSLGGVYTSIYVPELRVLFDVGLAVRAAANADLICLTHGHPDHIGGLAGFMTVRSLRGKDNAMRVVCPSSVVDDVKRVMDAFNGFYRVPFELDITGVQPGDRIPLRGNLSLRVVPSYHVVPCVSYLVEDEVVKLKAEFAGVTGAELGKLRAAGVEISEKKHNPELGFVTDTLVQTLDNTPELYRAKLLVCEATFLNDGKSIEEARKRTHIHVRELAARSEQFHNKDVVLIHFSQMYSPIDVRRILFDELQGYPNLMKRVVPFLGDDLAWPL